MDTEKTVFKYTRNGKSQHWKTIPSAQPCHICGQQPIFLQTKNRTILTCQTKEDHGKHCGQLENCLKRWNKHHAEKAAFFATHSIHNWKPEYVKDAIQREQFMEKGGSISCGHSETWWKTIRSVPSGHIVYCDRCGQFFVKMVGLPWLCERRPWFNPHEQPPVKRESTFSTNHLEGLSNIFYHPVRARFTTD